MEDNRTPEQQELFTSHRELHLS